MNSCHTELSCCTSLEHSMIGHRMGNEGGSLLADANIDLDMNRGGHTVVLDSVSAQDSIVALGKAHVLGGWVRMGGCRCGWVGVGLGGLVGWVG